MTDRKPFVCIECKHQKKESGEYFCVRPEIDRITGEEFEYRQECKYERQGIFAPNSLIKPCGFDAIYWEAKE